MGPSATVNATSNYVTLGVGDEIFAVDVAIVREILAYRTVAHLPNAPPFLQRIPVIVDHSLNG
jgi:chemotaxis signal transduction protein